MVKKRGDDMAEGKWDKDKDNPEKDQPRKALDQTLSKQRSSESNVVSPSKEESEGVEKALFTKEEEKDGVVTITSSIDEDTANKFKAVSEGLPRFQNLTMAVHGVPGDVNLTMDGTLNNDRSERMDKTVEEMNELTEKVAGPNPMPNREGNEMTKAENGLVTSIAVNAVMGFSELRNGLTDLSDENKKKLDKFGKQLAGVA